MNTENVKNTQMNNLDFDDGFQQISIKNDMNRLIRWNPTDVNFVDRWMVFQTYVDGALKKRISEVRNQLELDKSTGTDTYNQGDITELGKEINQRLNEVFDFDVVAVAFQGANPLSPIANGNLLFINFIDALTPIIQKSIKNFEDARKKYTNRAQRRAAGKPSQSKAAEIPQNSEETATNETGGGDNQ